MAGIQRGRSLDVAPPTACAAVIRFREPTVLPSRRAEPASRVAIFEEVVAAVKTSRTCVRGRDLRARCASHVPARSALDLYATRRVNCMTAGSGGHF